MSIQWENAGFQAWPGKIADDGNVSGKIQNVSADIGTWHSAGSLKCVMKPQQPPPPPPPPPTNTMKVTGDVDVYDVPGGTGKVIGLVDGGEGHTVQMGSGCRTDKWCNIVWVAGPNGKAWVRGDFLSK